MKITEVIPKCCCQSLKFLLANSHLRLRGSLMCPKLANRVLVDMELDKKGLCSLYV